MKVGGGLFALALSQQCMPCKFTVYMKGLVHYYKMSHVCHRHAAPVVRTAECAFRTVETLWDKLPLSTRDDPDYGLVYIVQEKLYRIWGESGRIWSVYR